MTDFEVIGVLLHVKSGRRDYETFDKAISAVDMISKIRTITERALKAEDPINLYKARALEEISKILGIETAPPTPDPADNNDNQITFDDIIEEA